MESFKKLSEVNVSELTKKKGKFDYLPWSVAIREVTKLYPDFTWDFKEWDGLPFLKTECGYFVGCSVVISGIERKSTLPVLDFKNQVCQAPKANDINKAQLRCLTKTIAMHGLGLDLWAGDDPFPERNQEQINQYISKDDVDFVTMNLSDENGLNVLGKKIHSIYGFNTFEEIKQKDIKEIKELINANS